MSKRIKNATSTTDITKIVKTNIKLLGTPAMSSVFEKIQIDARSIISEYMRHLNTELTKKIAPHRLITKNITGK